jgi:hypothetical protein
MMLRLALLALFAAVLGTPAVALAQEPGIERLDWLIGEWDFADAEIDGEYRETGTRVCEYMLGGDYIVCESEGTDHRGRTRSYVWYFNYNDREERYEITSLFQGLGMKALDTAEVSENGHWLEISCGVWEGDGVVVEGGATVVYNGTDRYVWGNDRYRDVVTRR